MKHSITTAIFVALLSVLQAQIEIQPNYPPGGCFCEGPAQQPFIVKAEGSAGPFTYEWSDPNFGNETPDAEISGIVHDFKTFDSPNNVNGKVYNHIIASGSRSNAPGVSLNLQGNNASLIDVNQGLDDVRLLIDNTGVPSGMAEQVGLVYSDGSVKFLSKNDIINGAYF